MAKARDLWVLKLFGQASTAFVHSRSSFSQSGLRRNERTPQATTIKLSAVRATTCSQRRCAHPETSNCGIRLRQIAYTARTAQPTNPINGMYRKRSAMMLPMHQVSLTTGQLKICQLKICQFSKSGSPIFGKRFEVGSKVPKKKKTKKNRGWLRR